MRRVVLLPQPDGPTSTMNSRSAMSRSIPWTAGVLSKVLTILRRATCAMGAYLFIAPAVQTGNVVSALAPPPWPLWPRRLVDFIPVREALHPLYPSHAKMPQAFYQHHPAGSTVRAS